MTGANVGRSPSGRGQRVHTWTRLEPLEARSPKRRQYYPCDYDRVFGQTEGPLLQLPEQVVLVTRGTSSEKGLSWFRSDILSLPWCGVGRRVVAGATGLYVRK